MSGADRARYDQLAASLVQHIDERGRLAVVKAPPGSGKTYLLLQLAEHAVARSQRVAIGAQTNAQADDICRRLSARPGVSVARFASAQALPVDLGPNVRWVVAPGDLPPGPAVSVGTVSKWGLVDIVEPFDVLFIDEAWQMAWADFMLCGQVSERFVLIGDPGQIPPVVPIEVQRWETAPRAPHRAAPDLILEDRNLSGLEANMDICRRLPVDAVALVQPFYDFPFHPLAEPGERYVRVNGSNGVHAEFDPALDLLGEQSVSAVTVPTDPEGPPFEVDPGVAALTAKIVHRLLDRGADVADGEDVRPLEPEHIGVSATHRVMNAAIDRELGGLRRTVRVETPERWQGLERKVMVVVHPLSGNAAPSGFDLTTGRLCVMASRHRSGLVVVSRDHVRRTLDGYIPAAEQPVGHPDIVGRGHFDHMMFWEQLAADRRLIELSA
jgi:hypothetical protein